MNFNILQCSVLSTLCLILCPSTVQSLEPIDRPPFYLNERECMDMFPESFKKDATNAKLRKSEEPFDLSLDRKEYNPDASVTGDKAIVNNKVQIRAVYYASICNMSNEVTRFVLFSSSFIYGKYFEALC